MELSPVPLAPLFDSVRTDGTDQVRQKGRDLCIRPTRAVIMSNTVLLDGIVENLVRNAIKYAGGCFRKLWRRPSGPLIRRQSPKCQGTSRNSDPSANAPGQGCRVAPPAIKTSAAKVKMVFAGPVARTQPNRGDALRRCRRPAILNRDGTTLVQPSSCVVLVRTCFPSWTATIA